MLGVASVCVCGYMFVYTHVLMYLCVSCAPANFNSRVSQKRIEFIFVFYSSNARDFSRGSICRVHDVPNTHPHSPIH